MLFHIFHICSVFRILLDTEVSLSLTGPIYIAFLYETKNLQVKLFVKQPILLSPILQKSM